MNLSSYIPLFLLGLSGTGHCIGMCGPLIIAFPGKTGKIGSHLCYHAGRILTYTCVGIITGSIGLAITKITSFAGFDSLSMIKRIQIAFSFFAATFLLVLGLVQLGILREPARLYIVQVEKIPGYTRLIRSAFAKSNLFAMGITGMLTGFLPCGHSFAAFSRALAANHPLEGGLLLLAFGIGTLPGLILLGSGASVLSRKYRRQFDLFSGMLMIGMAASLIMKGIKAIT